VLTNAQSVPSTFFTHHLGSMSRRHLQTVGRLQDPAPVYVTLADKSDERFVPLTRGFNFVTNWVDGIRFPRDAFLYRIHNNTLTYPTADTEVLEGIYPKGKEAGDRGLPVTSLMLRILEI